MPAVKDITLISAAVTVLKIKNAVNLSAWNVQECMAATDQWGALRDLVPFVQFKKREKHPCRSVNFSKTNTPPWVFFTFLKLYK